jgi:Anti-sigma-K factor rskA/Putative zinc-finger
MNCDTARDLAPAFVLGALERDEERALREHLATCSQPHPEFEAFGGIAQYFDETVELIEPPASLKARVLAAAAAEPRAGRAAATEVATGAPPLPVAAPPILAPTRDAPRREAAPTRPRERSRTRWLLAIAAVVAIAALGGWNVLLQLQLGAARDYDRAVATVLDVAARQGSQTAILSGDGGAGPRGIAAMAADGSVAIAMRDLEPTSGSAVYEAWVIGPSGTPAPIGSFHVAANGTASLTARATPANGATIALTREPGPGATAPTLPIVSKGVATAPPS